MSKVVTIFAAVIGIFALELGLGLLFAFPVMWLTNYLFSTSFLLFVFGSKLTFWKAYAFSVFMSWMVKPSITTKS